MIMEASVSKERKQAFILNQSNLKKIWDLLEERIGPVSAEISCADGIHREFSNWKQFTLFDNPRQKKIISLSMNARADNWSKSVHLRFSKSSWENIELRIKGTEQVVSRLNDDINDIVDGIRPWYSKLARIDFGYVIAFLYGSIFMCIGRKFLNETKETDKGPSSEKLFLWFVFFVCGFAIVFCLSWLLNKLKTRVFPIATFALGQGEQRYHLDEKIRWTIVIGFIVSLIASLVVSLFI